MPIYEYICGKCGKHFEKKQGFDEDPVALCPFCKGDSKRSIQCVPVIFRGSGFYVTDYKKENACAVSPGTDKESTPAVNSETKKETTSAASSDSKNIESKSSESKKVEAKSQESKSNPQESRKE